ncbi:site-2 protease family protein [Patescibacteria group bacterium]|nr:site-2 protease family protein [Patescibacteria group bacterium]
MLLGLLSDFSTFVFFIVALVIAITIHEFSHAWMATRLGDPTAKLSGRLTLNPLSHLDPLGTIMLFLAGFGWGRPVPYNPNFVRNKTFGEVGIALAGPISNILMAFLFALPGRIYLLQTGVSPEGNLFRFLAVVVTLNVLLATFNLLPIPPLDGSKLLYLILDKLTFRKVDLMVFERTGPMILLGIIFAERVFDVNIIFRILEPVIFVINWIVGSSGTF